MNPKETVSDVGLTGPEIVIKVSECGCNLSIIAAAMTPPVSPAIISNTIHRRGGSKRVAQAIAKILNMPVKNIFKDKPEWWENAPTSEQRKQLHREERVHEVRQKLAS